MNAKQLTAAETIVMKCIWDADHEMSLAEIVKNANEGYEPEERSPMKYSSRKRTTRVSRRGSLSHSGIMVRSSSLSPLFIRMNRLPKTRLRNFGMLLRNWKSSFRVKEVYSS